MKPYIGRCLKAAPIVAVAAYLALSMHSGRPIRNLPAGLDFKNGDVLVLGSSTLRGRLLKCLDFGTSWAHAGIVAVEPSGQVVLMHADPQRGAVEEPLDKYLKDWSVDALCLMRPKSGDGDIAARCARGIIAANPPFDDSFRYGEGEGIYCTELALLAWNAAGSEIVPGVSKGEKVMPSRLATSPALVKVWEILSP